MHQDASHQWLAQPDGIEKINFDEVVACNRHGGEVAAVFRDHDGLYLGSSCQQTTVYQGDY